MKLIGSTKPKIFSLWGLLVYAITVVLYVIVFLVMRLVHPSIIFSIGLIPIALLLAAFASFIQLLVIHFIRFTVLRANISPYAYILISVLIYCLILFIDMYPKLSNPDYSIRVEYLFGGSQLLMFIPFIAPAFIYGLNIHRAFTVVSDEVEEIGTE